MTRRRKELPTAPDVSEPCEFSVAKILTSCKIQKNRKCRIQIWNKFVPCVGRWGHGSLWREWEGSPCFLKRFHFWSHGEFSGWNGQDHGRDCRNAEGAGSTAQGAVLISGKLISKSELSKLNRRGFLWITASTGCKVRDWWGTGPSSLHEKHT